MDLKISELVAKTDTPKSTILYYIKEGLLPEAKKLKSNVHKYSEEHVELIKYIKYMKEEMGSTNEQIKVALEQKNNSFSGSYTMLAPLMQTLSCIPLGAKHYTKKEFIEEFEVNEKLLNKLLDDGVLIPISEDDYTQKEAAIINLVENFQEVGVNYEILKQYVHHANELSKLEYQMQINLCDQKESADFSILWKVMFDTLFNTKEYIFNRSTYKILHHALQDELKQQ